MKKYDDAGITEESPKGISNRNYVVSVILSAIFGVIGVHHFYLRRWAMGIFDFLLFVTTIYFYIQGNFTLGTVFLILDGLHTLFVTYQLLTGQYREGDGKLVTYPGQKI
jgi:TM2 domain-containing membrane protein YozV